VFFDWLETHEIARGPARAKAVVEPSCWLRVCHTCHRTVVAAMPIVQQLARKKIADAENYNRETVLRLRGRPDTSVTEAEVDAEIDIIQRTKP